MKKIKLLFERIKINEMIESKWFSYSVIALFSLFIVWPCLFGAFHIGDDEMFHIATIDAYSYCLPFSMFAKILPEIGGNLGYGVAIFYPALPHIIGAIILKIISVFGLGLIAMESILHFLIFLFAGITMFWFSYKVFKDNKKALFSSLFYITYNYFFVDVVMRDALNESFLFIFMPLVFLGLYYLFYEKNIKKFYIWFVFGYLGLIYSHLVMTVYFTIFLIIVLLFYIKDVFKRENFKHLLLATILILLLSSTFTVLMIEHKIFGDYYVFNNRKWDINSIWNMPFSGYFIPYYYATSYDGLIFSNINIIVIIFMVLTIIKIIFNKILINRKKFIIAMGMFGFLGIILNCFTFIWLYVPSLLLNIQFLWRLSIFVGFGFAIFASESLDLFFDCFKKNRVFVGVVLLLLTLGYFVYYNNTKIVQHHDFDYENHFTYGAVREYFPTSTYLKYKEYYNNRNDREIIILNGDADIKILSNDVPKMKFSISNLKEKTTIELPRLYYLGYQITDKDGKKINYKEDKYGFMSLDVVNNGVYTVNYVGTFAYKIAVIIKSLTVLVIISYYIYYRRKKA